MLKINMQKIKITIILLIAVYSLLLANSVLAAGLVPCGGTGEPACTFCDFFQMLQGILEFIMKLAFIIAPILIVICGVMFIVAAGNLNLLKRAKEGLLATVIGIAIILSAWVIVTAVFKAVGVEKENGHWYEFQCK